MELWIRSQSKKTLVRCTNVVIQEYFEGDVDIRELLLDGGDILLGRYTTLERAKEILNEIQNILKPKIIFKANDTQIYGINPNVYKINAVGNLINTDIQELSTYVYEMPSE